MSRYTVSRTSRDNPIFCRTVLPRVAPTRSRLAFPSTTNLDCADAAPSHARYRGLAGRLITSAYRRRPMDRYAWKSLNPYRRPVSTLYLNLPYVTLPREQLVPSFPPRPRARIEPCCPEETPNARYPDRSRQTEKGGSGYHQAAMHASAVGHPFPHRVGAHIRLQYRNPGPPTCMTSLVRISSTTDWPVTG